MHIPPFSGILKPEAIRMLENTLWHRASQINIQTGPHVSGGFDLGFDQDIPESTRAELTAFVHWAEDHFRFPASLKKVE